MEYQTYIVHWKQSDNPIKLDGGSCSKAPGLFVYPCTINIDNFRGLALSTIKRGNVISTFLDGNPGQSSWHYAVGMYTYTDDGWYKKGIPGANGAEKRVTLWVRISNSTINISRKKINFCLYIIVIVFNS